MATLRKEIDISYNKLQLKTQNKLKSFRKIHCLNETYSLRDDKVYFERAKDTYIYDYDGNKYLDFSMGAGTTLFGHASPIILDNVKDILDNGTIFTSPNMKAHELAEKLNKILYLDDFIFCNSGAESTSRAMRIARAYTNRNKIAIFSGGWHGGHDYGLVDDNYDIGDNSIVTPILKSQGIPPEILDTMILLPYNDKKAFEIIDKNKNDIAAVFIEPSQGSNPRDDMKEFLVELRGVTKKSNILLCFDEIITGFRIAKGGAQEYYDIDIDMATYAKTIGGGFPFGIIAGKHDIMKTIKEKSIFMGGTFSANPISITSSLSVVNYLLKNDIYENLNNNAKFLKESINNYCIENNISLRISNFGSMFRFIFTDKFIRSRKDRDKYEIPYEIQNVFYKDLLNNGIYIGSNRINFISTMHTKKILEQFIEKVIATITKLQKDKLI
ncbi:MAG: aminotransferase class III-fold pyridoxal phosphate-dependent enzyme [Flavobacteriales bacterium]|nr:aminotransferase class III-fold pyridoxal phosphate-dependent enzyme [Flavobacteriales bacterium]